MNIDVGVERKKVLAESRLKIKGTRRSTIHFKVLPEVEDMLDMLSMRMARKCGGVVPYGARSHLINLALRRALPRLLRKGKA